MSRKKASQEPSNSQQANEELNDDELGEVAGGVAIGVQPPPTGDTNLVESHSDAIISPRDPASGMPTGKRMHKPITLG